MGVDVWMRCDCCGMDTGEFSVTYNLSGAWYEIFPNTKMMDFGGLTAKESLPMLNCIIAEFSQSPERYKKHEPSNGWGTIEGFLETLRGMRELAERMADKPSLKWRTG